MRLLRGLGIWFLSIVSILLIFSFILTAGDDGKVHISGIYFYIALILPVVLAIVFSKKREEAVSDPTDKMESPLSVQRTGKIEIYREKAPIRSTPLKTNSMASAPIKDRDPLEIIKLMERRFEEQYQFAYKKSFNLHDCQRLYAQTVKEFDSAELPLMAQVRFEQLCAEYKEKFNITNPFVVIDAMEGHTFEEWCAELLRKNGFVNVEVTPGSGDQGVDVTAVKDGIRYAIQCKCYSSDLGNKPIQEVYTGKNIYKCQVGVVMTNRHFTPGAKEMAEATGVLLWDRDKLEEMIVKAE